MDGLETILGRRSCRSYTDTPVPDDVIETLLRAGMYAPSANNSQPWEFLVVREKEMREAASVFGPYWGPLKDAPLGIFVLANMNVYGEAVSPMFVQDCAAATENILLAVRALGLGGVWLGLYPREERIEPVRKLFGIPENVVPVALISIGYPSEEAAPHTEFYADKVHYDKY